MRRKLRIAVAGAGAFGREHLRALASMDRIEIVTIEEKITTQAGTFAKSIHVVESSPLQKRLRDHKWYVSGVGQVKDGEMVLVKYGIK